jgi:hypothetical protein
VPPNPPRVVPDGVLRAVERPPEDGAILVRVAEGLEEPGQYDREEREFP